jgi:16S rRNA (cytosine1402-N4)-methyltransferase
LLNEAVDALLHASAQAHGHLRGCDLRARRPCARDPAQAGPAGRLIAFDKDAEAVAEAARIEDARFSIRHQGFRQLGELPEPAWPAC